MIKINLLAEEKPESSRPVRRRIYAGVILLVLVGMGVGLLFWGKEKAPSSHPTVQTTPALSEDEPAEKKEVEEEHIIAEVPEQDTAKACFYSHILTDIRTSAPLSVHLSTIGFVYPGECFIQGKAASVSLAEELARCLERLSGVKTVEPLSMAKRELTGGDAGFEFTIWMKTDELSIGTSDPVFPVQGSQFMAQISRQATGCGAIPGKWVLRQERLTVDISGKCSQIESFLAALWQAEHLSNLARLFVLPADGESINWENLRVCMLFVLPGGEG